MTDQMKDVCDLQMKDVCDQQMKDVCVMSPIPMQQRHLHRRV